MSTGRRPPVVPLLELSSLQRTASVGKQRKNLSAHRHVMRLRYPQRHPCAAFGSGVKSNAAAEPKKEVKPKKMEKEGAVTKKKVTAAPAAESAELLFQVTGDQEALTQLINQMGEGVEQRIVEAEQHLDSLEARVAGRGRPREASGSAELHGRLGAAESSRQELEGIAKLLDQRLGALEQGGETSMADREAMVSEIADMAASAERGLQALESSIPLSPGRRGLDDGAVVTGLQGQIVRLQEQLQAVGRINQELVAKLSPVDDGRCQSEVERDVVLEAPIAVGVPTETYEAMRLEFETQLMALQNELLLARKEREERNQVRSPTRDSGQLEDFQKALEEAQLLLGRADAEKLQFCVQLTDQQAEARAQVAASQVQQDQIADQTRSMLLLEEQLAIGIADQTRLQGHLQWSQQKLEQGLQNEETFVNNQNILNKQIVELQQALSDAGSRSPVQDNVYIYNKKVKEMEDRQTLLTKEFEAEYTDIRSKEEQMRMKMEEEKLRADTESSNTRRLVEDKQQLLIQMEQLKVQLLEQGNAAASNLELQQRVRAAEDESLQGEESYKQLLFKSQQDARTIQELEQEFERLRAEQRNNGQTFVDRQSEPYKDQLMRLSADNEQLKSERVNLTQELQERTAIENQAIAMLSEENNDLKAQMTATWAKINDQTKKIEEERSSFWEELEAVRFASATAPPAAPAAPGRAQPAVRPVPPSSMGYVNAVPTTSKPVSPLTASLPARRETDLSRPRGPSEDLKVNFPSSAARMGLSLGNSGRPVAPQRAAVVPSPVGVLTNSRLGASKSRMEGVSSPIKNAQATPSRR